MATLLWVIYDIILFVVGLWFLERNLTFKEKLAIFGLAAMGLAIAAYSGYSDYEQSAVIESLKNGQAYNTGQLNTIGQLSAKTLGLLPAPVPANPYQLSDDQIRRFRAAAIAPTGRSHPFAIMYTGACQECQVWGEKMFKVLNNLPGWRVDIGQIMGSNIF